MVTGGGSGGHITPILAVAHELKEKQPDAEIVYVGQKGDELGDIPAADKNIDRVKLVRAGKFRRYHGEHFLQRLLDVQTWWLNMRDAVWVVVGLWQSFQLLRQLRPDIIFVKGGFVGVPVGLAAALLRIPYVTHDSDAMPGLANRIIARWAHLHAVALPKDVYAYPADKTVTVGVPISHQYYPLSAKQQQAVRQQLKLDAYEQVLLVTGGGLGAQNINNAVVACMPELLERYPGLAVVHLTGRGKDSAVRQQYKQVLSGKDQKRVIVRDFVTNLHQYSGAADVVIARAGGTAVAELAAQAKPCIVVPNPLLAGGHQLKNARVLAERKAVRLVDEQALTDGAHAFMPALTDLLDHPDKAAALGKKLYRIAQPDAARHLAMILLDTARNLPEQQQTA